jgi:decaprenylphospho-beta-D-erythro-pentofuranosid-2-ulose 2-reductase
VATPMTQGLKLPGPLVAEPAVVARRIVAGIERKADVLYVPAWWALIMLVIRGIPRVLFKRMKL